MGIVLRNGPALRPFTRILCPPRPVASASISFGPTHDEVVLGAGQRTCALKKSLANGVGPHSSECKMNIAICYAGAHSSIPLSR